MRRDLAAVTLLLGALAAAPHAAAQQKEDPEARLRAALRTVTARVRELEDQNATLQAKQAEFDRDRAALADKAAAVEKEAATLRQQTAADKSALQQSVSQLQQQQGSLAKWQSSYQEAADAARTRDADAKRLDAALDQTRQRVKACETKNGELYKLGEQVLDLYDKRDFFDVVAGEPVTKLKRVEIENAMQDYEDKFRDNEIKRPPQ